ncbi:MAG: aminotransferase class I/II-fold pyridoxal phosphate-dependent enzyme [Sphingobium sp.]|nr:aminotransferase class I/II-fold pyridoxal phosphate-dependent enzyme [Sphingobium sp.]
MPFIDMAYQGLGDGWDADAAGARAMLDATDEAMLAYSCDKNFAFYRDRVGAFWLKSARAEEVRIAHGNIVAIARCLWSMPPDHGAATVRIVLDDPALRADWQAGLDMRGRINQLRTLLAAAHPALSPIGEQRGLFAMLPVSAQAVDTLRRDHGIYMASSGRINIAGLRTDQVPTLVEALRPHLPG